MAMIDTTLLKPASDAVQEAFQIWFVAGHAYGEESRRIPQDSVALDRAFKAMALAGKAYDDAKFALSHIVHREIGKAESESAEETETSKFEQRGFT